MRVVKQIPNASHSNGPRRGVVSTSISVTSQSLKELDTLADSDDELSSLMDLLSRARPLASRVVPHMIDLTVDSSDDVS